MMSDLFDYDAELRLPGELFRAAARVGSRDRVLESANINITRTAGSCPTELTRSNTWTG